VSLQLLPIIPSLTDVGFYYCGTDQDVALNLIMMELTQLYNADRAQHLLHLTRLTYHHIPCRLPRLQLRRAALNADGSV